MISCRHYLSKNKNIKYILVHLLTIFGYAKDVSILQQMGWNNSITNITRDLLECYAYAKKLIGLYGSSTYEDYVRNLVINDMDQDKRIYLSLCSDSTIVDIAKRDSEAQTYIQRFENLITEYFQNKSSEISLSNKESDILKIIKDLKKEYNRKYPENNDKSALISEAIQNNKLLQDYDGSKVLYKALCHSTHNTLSSLEERTLRNGFFMMNNCTYNIFCMCPIIILLHGRLFPGIHEHHSNYGLGVLTTI